MFRRWEKVCWKSFVTTLRCEAPFLYRIKWPWDLKLRLHCSLYGGCFLFSTWMNSMRTRVDMVVKHCCTVATNLKIMQNRLCRGGFFWCCLRSRFLTLSARTAAFCLTNDERQTLELLGQGEVVVCSSSMKSWRGLGEDAYFWVRRLRQ